MRIFHLASFSGNIGDEANHAGFYRNLRRFICPDIDVTQCEMRQFYRSRMERRFDDDFVNEVNDYDLFVIGGGNFFEICWDYSATGTTVDIAPELLDKITTPIFINGMGFDDHKGCSETTIKAFRSFLLALARRENVFITFRNDGSMSLLQKYFSPIELASIRRVPDGGFFFQPANAPFITPPEGRSLFGLCLACDMPEIRFGDVGFNGCAAALAGWLCDIMKKQPELDLMFVPHIFLDLRIIEAVISKIDDRYRRTRVFAAPLLSEHYKAADTVFPIYSVCSLVASMRFHAGVVPIGLGVPTIGLTSYPKHGMLYDELGIKERQVRICSDDWLERLDGIYNDTVGDLPGTSERYAAINRELEKQLADVYSELLQWLRHNNVL